VQTDFSDFSSFFSAEEKSLKFSEADPSVIFGFLLRNGREFDEFLNHLKSMEEEMGENFLLGVQKKLEIEELNKLKLRISMSLSLDEKDDEDIEEEKNEEWIEEKVVFEDYFQVKKNGERVSKWN
jgi:hypothetical protein